MRRHREQQPQHTRARAHPPAHAIPRARARARAPQHARPPNHAPAWKPAKLSEMGTPAMGQLGHTPPLVRRKQ
jgi:hypothetical protein